MKSTVDIKQDIIETLGFMPPFFEPAFSSAIVLENLWFQTKTAYLENPLPNLFKEKLAALLGRYCQVPYCLICHSSTLRPLGMTAEQILTLLQQPALGFSELSSKIEILESVVLGPDEWPADGSWLEEQIIHCCISIFLNQENDKCLSSLRVILGPSRYDALILFLAYNRTCLHWVEAHPELSYEADRRVIENLAPLLEEAPGLKEFFENYKVRVLDQGDRRIQWLARENKALLSELKENQDWLAATLHGIGDAVIATDASANPVVTFLNGVAENLTGWRLEDAKGKPMNEVFRVINETTRNAASDPVAKVIESGEVQILENHTLLISKNGREFVIEDSAAPIRSVDGQLRGVVLVFRDVTDHKKNLRERDELNQVQAQARQDLEDFFMQSPMPMVILDGPKHHFLLANPPYEKLVGRPSSGRPLLEVFTAEEIKIFTPILDEVYRSGISYVGKEMTLALVDDKGVIVHRWIDLGYHPTRSADGRVKGILAIVQDVTEAKRSRENLISSESNFRAFADSTPQIVFTTTPEGSVDYVNPRWYEYTSAQQQQTLGTAYLSTINPDDLCEATRKWKLALNKRSRFETELRFRRGSDGAYRWFLIRVEPKFESGELVRWYGSATDIDDQKMSARDLTEAKEEADRANQTKSAFLANMSHEIRTPLGAILGFTELLRDREIGEQEKNNYLEIIRRNGKSLSRVIDDILDLSKVEAGKLSVEMIPVHLPELLNDVKLLFQDKVRLKKIALGIHLSPHCPETILSDPTRLRQILINIIGNAIKFTEVGGVSAWVHASERDNDQWLIKILVKDTGRGLSPARAKNLFEPFKQADSSTTREFGGTGLGLVLSRRLALALGGNVEIETCAEGQGCTFAITFLGQRVEKQIREEKYESSVQIGGDALFGVKILLVEDAPDNQILIRKVLTKAGGLVTNAGNGFEGVQMLEAGRYDIVLMDIQMPVMDGFQAMAKLRASGNVTPVIALTAHAMAEDVRRTKSAGFQGHVTKPIDRQELIRTIRNLHTEYQSSNGIGV